MPIYMQEVNSRRIIVEGSWTIFVLGHMDVDRRSSISIKYIVFSKNKCIVLIPKRIYPSISPSKAEDKYS